MKGIKRFSLMMAAVFTLGGLSMANANETREERKGMDPKVRAEKMTERMVKEYNLTDVQKQQLLDVNQAMAEKMSTHPARPHHGKKGKPGEMAKDRKDKKEGNVERPKREKKDGEQARADRDGRRNRADAPKLSAEEREKLQQEMKKVRDDYNAQLQKIMTSEQYQAYAQKQTERVQKKTERGEKMKENRGKKSGSGKGGRQA